jgi:DNA repair protein RadC
MKEDYRESSKQITFSENHNNYTIKHLPLGERPRERFIRHGEEAMTTAELIAIILSNGIKGKTVLQLSHELLSHFGSLERLSGASIEELCQIKGLGLAKAVQIKAAFSLGLRSVRNAELPKYQIKTPLHAYNLLKDDLVHKKREHFVIVLLDAKGFLIRTEVISIGTLTNTLVHPREVFHPAVRHNAASIILVHNHPSGDPTPSHNDYSMTEQLVASSKVMGISVNDHLIIGKDGYVSLREKGVVF